MEHMESSSKWTLKASSNEAAMLNCWNDSNCPTFSLVREALSVGDFHLVDTESRLCLVVERKSFPDLLSSLEDGRYHDQVGRLRDVKEEAGCPVVLLLEGTDVRVLSDPRVRGVVFAAQRCYGFVVVYSTSPAHSWEVLDYLCRKERDGWKPRGSPPAVVASISARRSDKFDPRKWMAYALSIIPNMSVPKAELLQEHFGHVGSLAASLQSEEGRQELANMLFRKRRLGPSLAGSIATCVLGREVSSPPAKKRQKASKKN